MTSAVHIFTQYDESLPTIHILEIVESWCSQFCIDAKIEKDWYGEVVTVYGTTGNMHHIANIMKRLGFASSLIYSVGKNYADPQPKPV